MDAGHLAEAKAGFERALAMGREQLKQNPSSIAVKLRLATSYGRLAVAVARAGQLAEATRLCEAGVALTDEVVAETPHAKPEDLLSNTRYIVAEDLYVALGVLAQQQGQPAEAKRRWEQALAIDEAVLNLVPSAQDAERTRNIYVNLAMLAADSQDLALAKQRFEQGIALDEQLLAQHPTQVEYRLHSANLHIGLGLLVKDPEHARQAQLLLAAAETQGSLAPSDRKQLEYLKQKAAEMLNE